MSTLTVWKFSSPDGADEASETLNRLVGQELVKGHDAATVSWEEGRMKPKTRQLHNLVGAGALGGMSWGMLSGPLFVVPLLGVAVGAATGALSGMFADVGIDDGFINPVQEEVTPGTSVLFLLSSDAVLDRVKDAFAGQETDLLRTKLSSEEGKTHCAPSSVRSDSSSRRAAAQGERGTGPVCAAGVSCRHHRADENPAACLR